MSITFKGFDILAEQLDRVSGNIKPAVDESLKQTQNLIQNQIKPTMKPHKRSGRTEKSIIKDLPVHWLGNIAEIDVGFKIRDGGFPSIFLMWGTPRMNKDVKLYNAIRGAKTKREIKRVQMEIMEKYISLGKKG